MSDVQELKSKVDIVTASGDLGILPSRSGPRYQGGDCPSGHGSDGKKCFVIYPDTQSAHCFNCGSSWDVIGLVQKVLGLDFIPACNWLSDKYDLPYLQSKDMTPEEKAQYEERLKEEKAIFNILTVAARYYHKALLADEKMKGHLINHYGLNEETISTHSLGYSTGPGLWEHLHSLGYSTEHIKSSGLFVKIGNNWKEFFQHRLMFPYWKSGQVVYFIGRRTDRTPEKKWELAKYKNLPTNNEKHPYISKAIQNKWFYGEDSIRGVDSVFVAEGVADCLSMNQAGYPAISPVTTRFRASDTPHLERLTSQTSVVYMVPDNEDNLSGINGAMDTACKLEELDRTVYIITLPKPQNVEKIDITDFLRDHGKEAFEKLVSKAKTPLQLEIYTIAKQNLDLIRLSEALSPIKEKLAEMKQSKAVGYLDYLKSALGVKADFIQGLKRKIRSLKENSTHKRSSEDEKVILSASYPRLIDLVINNGKISYLYKGENGPITETFYIDKSDNKLTPPGADAIPFDILPADRILKYENDTNYDLYWAIFAKLKKVSVLPTEEHYHLCTIYIFFTYISESSAYYPYLWFYGLQERGKSRIVKAITNLSYRGFYTETLNEAYIFRLADLFCVTLALDLYELSERAQKKGSHDLLLGRYERGMKVARVTNPDKGPFRDTTYYKVSGPTILATNIEIPAKDPLQSRCIKITMPEHRGIYPNNNSDESLLELKARLLSFRMRHLGEKLPEVDKPIAGRLGDIIHPLLCVSKLLPAEAHEELYSLIGRFEEERRENEAESLAGRIAQALYDLQYEVENGRLPFEKVRDKINEGVDDRFHIAPQTIGRELSAMAIKRRKSDGKMQIIFDQKVINKIWSRFTPYGHNLPNLPNLPIADTVRVHDREIKNDNLPDLPENREEREKVKNNLPDVKPCQSRDREIREEREITSKESERWEIGTI